MGKADFCMYNRKDWKCQKACIMSSNISKKKRTASSKYEYRDLISRKNEEGGCDCGGAEGQGSGGLGGGGARH